MSEPQGRAPHAASSELAEVTATLHALQEAFEELVVRGLKSSSPDDVRRLRSIGEAFGRAGAVYVAASVDALVRSVREDDDGAPRVLLRAQTAARVFERVLSLDAAAAALGGDAPGADALAGEVPDRPGGEATAVDRAPLLPVLDELAGLIEGLVASGMTTATAATRHKLDASFKEASRLKLLRLATSLRYVGDECGRFLAGSEHFSPRRLAFFLHRTWLIGRGLRTAIATAGARGAGAREAGDQLARLLLQAAPPHPVKTLTLAVVGVHKRALLDGSAAFDFRMVTLTEAPGIPRGSRLLWSCVFGAKPQVPAEAFLYLPQPQKFVPKLLLDPTEIVVTDAAATIDPSGHGRLVLGPKTTVKPGAKLRAWDNLVAWDPRRAVTRIRRHAISPLDLEVELQEEILVTSWQIGGPAVNPYRKDQQVFSLRTDTLELDAIVSTGRDGSELMTALRGFQQRKATRPPLYGLLHYEMGRLVFQPLTAFTDAGPEHLMISRENIDLASLMKTLDFTT